MFTMIPPSAFVKVPKELKKFPSFICWGLGGKMCKIPYSPITGEPASSMDPRHWGTYEEACAYAHKYGFRGIGFVLSEDDPFAFIDLDDPGDDPRLGQEQIDIFNTFQSYAEISPSGRGLHIIVKGSLPKGRRRNKVEVYSWGRYMTMSGRPHRNVPIISAQENLRRLYKNLGGSPLTTEIVNGDAPETESDLEIYEKALRAKNGEKFLDLWEGRWEIHYGHPQSQSEADFALVDILAFYTPSRNQIVRMFHQSALGQRDKAKRRDYLDYMLNRCFDQYLPNVDLSFLKDEIETHLAQINTLRENPKMRNKVDNNPYTFPPGLVGEIADFVLKQSPRPVPEIALTAALGLFSSITGRCYNVSSTGLNQYYLLLAPTGTGKEAIAQGIGKIMKIISKKVPGSSNFQGPGEMASAQGLIKHMSNGPTSFGCITGEFGLALKEMCGHNAPSHKVGLKRLLLDLYNKSGHTSELRPIVYADTSKNTEVIKSPAVTLIGESTPERFYETLDEDMIAEGLLPRFITIEYKGKRPPMNYRHSDAQPSGKLIEALGSLCSNAIDLNLRHRKIDVQFTAEANSLLDQFNTICDARINQSREDVVKQLWNRAHLKALKLSALVAIGLNPYNPTVCVDCAEWAKAFVIRDCSNISTKFTSGEMGSAGASELVQQKVMREFLTRFATCHPSKIGRGLKAIKNGQMYHADKVIPYSYIQRTLVGRKCFKLDRRGATAAIKQTLRTLQEVDDIASLSMKDRFDRYGSKTEAYVIKNPRLLGDS